MGRYKDFFPRDAGGLDAGADFGLVAVDGGGVNVAVASLERGFDGGFDFVGGRLLVVLCE